MNPNPSAWFVYAEPGNGGNLSDELARALDYSYKDYREGGKFVLDKRQNGTVFDCGSRKGMNPSHFKFIPQQDHTCIWVVEHDFFGDAICPFAKNPNHLDPKILKALQDCGLNLKVG